ncbi:MAG: hypothetical protein ACKPHM_00015, partial [Dolichospermum sp.]
MARRWHLARHWQQALAILATIRTALLLPYVIICNVAIHATVRARQLSQVRGLLGAMLTAHVLPQVI